MVTVIGKNSGIWTPFRGRGGGHFLDKINHTAKIKTQEKVIGPIRGGSSPLERIPRVRL